MPKESAAGSSQGGLVYLKYTFRCRDQFDEPNDDWLDCIEATSDELFSAYTRAEDDAMTLAFGGQGKKILNIVFDVIGFVYPNYYYPSQKQGRKRKSAASAIAFTPKLKKVKILTHRPKRAEATEAPKPAKGPSVSGSDCPDRAQAKGKSTEVNEPKVITEQQKAEMAEAKAKTAEEPELRKSAEQPKTLSPSQETELPTMSNIHVVTPKRRRMASVLDAIIESTKVLTPASAEVPNMGKNNTKESAEAIITQVGTEAGPLVPAETGPTEIVENNTEARSSDATRTPLLLEKGKTSKEYEFPTAEASTEGLEFIVRHTAGKNYQGSCRRGKSPAGWWNTPTLNPR
jgi:hypothetical protein